jgi:hypothetical protein
MKKLLLLLMIVPMIGFGQDTLMEGYSNINCKGDCVNGYGELNQRYDGMCGGYIYKGQFKNGLMDGWGNISYHEGGDYIGHFRENKMSGQGTYTWFNGTKYKYVGGWKDGMKHGQGEMFYADGSKYVGEFMDDRKNGQGTLTNVDGSVEKGQWENDEFLGN